MSETGPQYNYLWESTARLATFHAEFPKLGDIELTLIGAELFQSINSHDVLVLYFKGKPFLDSTIITSGDPIKFSWNTGPNVSVFNGYVYDVDPTSTTAANNTTVTCVSASYVMKDTNQEIYKNTTADAIVQKICKKNGLNSVTERHPRIHEQVVQAGQSDWQVLQRLALQCGFALRAENTTVYFLSKDKIYNDKKASAPYFRYKDGIAKAQRMLVPVLCLNLRSLMKALIET